MNGSPAVAKTPVATSLMPLPTSGTSAKAAPRLAPAPWMLVPPAWSTRPASANAEIVSWILAPITAHSATHAHVATSATISRVRAAGVSLQNFSIVASVGWLHPKDAEPRFGNRRMQRRLHTERQHAPGVERVDDAV